MTTNAPSYIPDCYRDDDAIEAAYRRGWQHGHGIACHCAPQVGDHIRPDIDWVGLGRSVTEENCREYHELVALHVARERMGAYWDDEDEVARAVDLEDAFLAGLEASVYADIAETDDEAYGIEPEDDEDATDDDEARVGDRVVDLLGSCAGIGEVIDTYTSYDRNPRGEPMLTVRWGDGDDAVVADRLPHEVRTAIEVPQDDDDALETVG